MSSDLRALPLESWADRGKCYYVQRPVYHGRTRYYELTLGTPNQLWRVYAKNRHRMYQVRSWGTAEDLRQFIAIHNLEPILPKWMQMDIGL
jgi:hypothetical protein